MFDERLTREYAENLKSFDVSEIKYEDGERAYPPHPGMHRHTGANYWHDRFSIHRTGSDAESVHR